jgi:hypothetical protein
MAKCEKCGTEVGEGVLLCGPCFDEGAKRLTDAILDEETKRDDDDYWNRERE